MKAVFYTAPGEVEVREIPEPVTLADEVKIKVEYCALCATDVHVVMHGLYGLQPPMIMGHEVSGTVVEIGEEAAKKTTLKVGDRVAAIPSPGCGECEHCKRGLPMHCDNAGFEPEKKPMDAMAEASAAAPGARRIYLGPRGRKLTTGVARELARESSLILLCGHYEGVDQRAMDACIDEEISIGDYILTGGELAAMVLTDCVARFIPGVLGSADSPEEESFSDGLLEYPQYTRPRDLDGRCVPEVLLSGDHAKIRAWRRRESLAATARLRPDLLASAKLDDQDLKILKELEESCFSES